VLKVLSKEAANMALLANNPGAMYWVYVSPFIPPSRMNAPSPEAQGHEIQQGLEEVREQNGLPVLAEDGRVALPDPERPAR
jgi:hypothetical protein